MTRKGTTHTSERRMPTTIPSPVDRGEYDFVAKDRDGREWRWDDEQVVWVLGSDDGDAECTEGD